MAGKYSIESVFSLIDKVTAPTSRISKALDGLGIKSKTVSNALKRDFDKAADRVDRLGKSLKKAAGYMAAAGVAAVGAGVTSGIRNAIEYQSAIAKVGTIADAATVPLAEMSKGILALSTRMGVGANDIAESTYQAISAGVSTGKALSVVEAATKAGIAGFTDTATAIDGLTSVLNAYSLSANNATAISDQMLIAQNLGKTSFGDMAKTMGQVIPTAAALKVKTEELFASIASLTSNAIPTSQAMTGIKAALSNVMKPSTNAAKMAKQLGIEFNAAALQGKGLSAFLKDLANATGGNQEILAQLFGSTEAVNAINVLIGSGSDLFEKAMSEMQNAVEATEIAFNKMMDTPEKRWGKAMNTIRNAGINLGNSLLPVVEQVIAKISGTANNLSKIDFSQYTASFEQAFGVIDFFVSALFGAIKIAWQFRGAIIAIAAPFLIYQGVLMAITIASSIYTKMMLVMSIVQKGLSVITGIATVVKYAFTLATQGQTAALAGLTAGALANIIVLKGLAIVTKIAAGVQWLLNAAMTANPIGIIIVAVGALIVALVLLIKNWKKVTAAIKNNINKVMLIITALFGPIGFIISMIKEVVANWDRIKDALATAGLFDKIKEIGTGIKNFIKPAIDWLINVWTTVKNAVGGFFSYIIGRIKSFFEPAINWVVSAWHTVTSVIGGFFKNIFDAVYNFVKPALDWFSEKWQQIVSFFTDNAIINAIKVIGGTLLSGLLRPIQGLLEILSNIPGLGHLAGMGADKIQEIRNALRGIDDTTITAAVTVPGTVSAELTPPVETPTAGIPVIPSLPIPNLTTMETGAETSIGGRSLLHGVVDISGGAVTSPLDTTSIRTISGIGGAASVDPSHSVLEIISRNVSGIYAILQRNTIPGFNPTNLNIPGFEGLELDKLTESINIPDFDMSNLNVPGFTESEFNKLMESMNIPGLDMSNLNIPGFEESEFNKLIESMNIPAFTIPETATETTVNFPRIRMDGDDGDTPESRSPREIAPITHAERMAYSVEERIERLIIEDAVERGTSARVIRAPRDAEIRLTRSGGVT